MMKALKDVSQIHKKSTSTHAPVAEPSLFISKKAKGKSENHVEEFKNFSDSLPTFDEYEEELIDNLMTCEENCDLPYLESELMIDNEQAIVELTVLQPEHPSSLALSQQVFEEEPLDYPHQGPRLDTRNPLDEDLGHIFDEEDEPGSVFDEETTSITSIIMESHLCFDPGTTPASLFSDIQKHCEKSDLLNSLPEMFVKISSHDVIRFGLDKMKEFCVSKSVFENMINSFKVTKSDELLDQRRFQKGNGINSGIILSFNQFMKHHKCFDPFEKLFELDLQQPVFCYRKSFDSFVCKENGFNLSSYKHALITGYFFAFLCALDEFMLKKLLEQKSPRVETDFCDSVLKPVHSYFESDLDFLCSESDQVRHDLEMFNKVSGLDIILICNAYFDVHFERLKRVLHVLGKETLFSDLNKYMSCTYDPGILMFTLSVQEKQVRSQRNKSIDRTYQPKIWRWKYLRKPISKLQGSLILKPFFDVVFILICLIICLASYLFPFHVGDTDLRTNLFQEGGNDTPRIVDPGQDDATMAEIADSSTKDKPGWINGEHTDLKPTGEIEDELKHRVHELEPAQERVHELKPAEVRVDDLSELSNTTLELDELSDTNLELNELSDTEDRAGLVAGRNRPFSAQRKIHNKFNLGRFYTKFDQAFADVLLPICIKKYQQKESKSWSGKRAFNNTLIFGQKSLVLIFVCVF